MLPLVGTPVVCGTLLVQVKVAGLGHGLAHHAKAGPSRGWSSGSHLQGARVPYLLLSGFPAPCSGSGNGPCLLPLLAFREPSRVARPHRGAPVRWGPLYIAKTPICQAQNHAPVQTRAQQILHSVPAGGRLPPPQRPPGCLLPIRIGNIYIYIRVRFWA